MLTRKTLLIVLVYLCAMPGIGFSGVTTIVAFGDSTTARRNTVRNVYADRLESELRKRGMDVAVINSGVGGSHTGRSQENARHPGPHARDRFDTAVRNHAPQIVIVQFGWNDSWVDNGDPLGPSRIPRTAYRDNLRFIVGTLQKDGSRVVLMTPNRPRTTVPAWQMRRTYQYTRIVRELAAEMNVDLVDVWKAYSTYHEQHGDLNQLLLDGVHPNDAGHTLVAEMLVKEISAGHDRDPQP